MTDPAAIAAQIRGVHRFAMVESGLVYGQWPYHASVMRPLVRRGLFERKTVKGFQTRWALTPLGISVRNIIQEQSK